MACTKGSSTSAGKAHKDRATALPAAPRLNVVGKGQDGCWGQLVCTWRCQPEWDGLFFGSCSRPNIWSVYRGGFNDFNLTLYREGGISVGNPLSNPGCRYWRISGCKETHALSGCAVLFAFDSCQVFFVFSSLWLWYLIY